MHKQQLLVKRKKIISTPPTTCKNCSAETQNSTKTITDFFHMPNPFIWNAKQPITMCTKKHGNQIQTTTRGTAVCIHMPFNIYSQQPWVVLHVATSESYCHAKSHHKAKRTCNKHKIYTDTAHLNKLLIHGLHISLRHHNIRPPLLGLLASLGQSAVIIGLYKPLVFANQSTAPLLSHVFSKPMKKQAASPMRHVRQNPVTLKTKPMLAPIP